MNIATTKWTEQYIGLLGKILPTPRTILKGRKVFLFFHLKTLHFVRNLDRNLLGIKFPFRSISLERFEMGAQGLDLQFFEPPVGDIFFRVVGGEKEMASLAWL